MTTYTIKSGVTVNIDGIVKDEIVVNSKSIVRFDKFNSALESLTPSNNILCFDEKGQQIWIIEKRDISKYPNPYIYLSYYDDKFFKTANFLSDEMFLVDIETGKFHRFL